MSATNNVYAEENATDSKESKFFVIQHAQSGSLSEINETAYSLELNEISDTTILFSDIPDRIVKSISTSDLVGNWTTGENSFVLDPPNAVLVVDESEKQDIAIIELFNPVYGVDTKALKYDTIPDNATSVDLQSEFGQTTMIIDCETVDVYPTVTPIPVPD